LTDQCVALLAGPTWNEHLSGWTAAQLAASTAIRKSECSLGYDPQKLQKLRERSNAAWSSFVPKLEMTSGCRVQAEKAKMKAERLKNIYDRNAAIREASRKSEDCVDRQHTAHWLMVETTYRDIVRDSGF